MDARISTELYSAAQALGRVAGGRMIDFVVAAVQVASERTVEQVMRLSMALWQRVTCAGSAGIFWPRVQHGLLNQADHLRAFALYSYYLSHDLHCD